MPLVHIVLFEFKPSVERAVIQDVCQVSFGNAGQSRGLVTVVFVLRFLSVLCAKLLHTHWKFIGLQKRASFEAELRTSFKQATIYPGYHWRKG